MTLDELRAELRLTLDDARTPYLWSDDELDAYLNRAVTEYLNRKGGIQDEVSIPTEADTADYDYPAYLLRIERAQLTGAVKPLIRMSRRDLDIYKPNWQSLTAATIDDVKFYILDTDLSQLTLVPTPEVADWALHLDVFRFPALPMINDADQPEVRAGVQPYLLLWAAHLAFSKRDADTYNPKLAMEFAQRFEQMVGKVHSAADVDFERDFQQARVRPRAFI